MIILVAIIRFLLSLHKANGVRFGRIQFCHLHASLFFNKNKG